MSTLRISNIEAKADASSPTVNEKLKFTSSPTAGQDPLLHLDGLNAASGITTIGINTTGNTITVKGNDVNFAGIVTALKFSGPFTDLTINDDLTVSDGLTVSGIATFNNDVNFQTANGNNIFIDKSDNSIKLGNSVTQYFGGTSMWLMHNGSTGYLNNGTGDLYIRDNDGDIYIQGKAGEHSIICNNDGQVDLFYDNTKRLSTSGIGVTVTGTIDLDAISKTLGTTPTPDSIFVYDTRKDSDGGAWRKRTSHTSWYNETFGAKRGSKKEFPAVAVIQCSSNDLYIYDADDPEMPLWMHFDQSGGNDMINTYGGDSLQNPTMFNGHLAICNAAYDLWRVDFIKDIGYHTYTTGTSYYKGNIEERDDDKGFSAYLGTEKIPNRQCNDVEISALPGAPIDPDTGLPKPTIVTGTNDGISFIHHADGLTGDYSSGIATNTSYDAVNMVKIKGDTLYTLSEPRLLYTWRLPFRDSTSGVTFTGYSGLVWLSAIQKETNTSSTSSIVVKNNKDIAVGTASELLLIAPQYRASGNELEDASGRMVASIGSDYNSGWMCGGQKGAWLADTDDTNITGTELLTNGDFGSAVGSTWVVRENGGTLVTNGSNQGVLTYVSGATSWKITGTVVVGKTYTISFDIVSTTTTSIQAYYDNGSGSVAISIAGTAGKHGHTFVATSTSVDIYPRIFASGNMVVDNFSLREAVDDRAKYNEGLAIHGSITKTAVATGAELVSYGPFSSSNFLRGTYRGTSVYTSVHHYETGNFHVMFWMNNSGTNIHQSLVGRDNREFAVDILDNDNYDRKFRIYSFNSSNSLQTFDSNSDPFPINSWNHVCVNYTGGNTVSIYVNGILNKSGALDYDIDDTTNGINIGVRNTSGTYAYPANGTKLALVRIGTSAPSEEQISRIFYEEKKLFAENAKCTLYGSSSAVTATGYDDATDTVHVGTSAGRSDFVGLNRINNTTTAVSNSISASNGVIAEN